MAYTIRSFNSITGQISVEFDGGQVYELEVPIQNGAYYNGQTLIDYINSYDPLAYNGRVIALAANPSGGDSIASLVDPLPAVLVYQTQFSSNNFLDKFTADEQVAVLSATLVNIPLKLFYDKMLAADYVDIEDLNTIGGLAALVAASLLTEARKIEILTPVLIS
ncbi:MAG: hypothetical protein COB23_09630 [Methylophaga sp.]|nr:MAG: hypothetical protein COB23_09630 [Methylophaga sp.]